MAHGFIFSLPTVSSSPHLLFWVVGGLVNAEMFRFKQTVTVSLVFQNVHR